MGDGLILAGLRIAAGDRQLVRGVDLEVRAGEVVALVGSSGCGKTLTALSVLGLVDLEPGVVAANLTIRVGDEVHRPYTDCLGASRRQLDRAFRDVRGRLVGYLPQDARAALDPLQRVGRQVSTSATLRTGKPDEPAAPWLLKAGLPNPTRVERLFPHELSGGMAQRVVIAQALARGSRFLLADEPTTGLDPTVQSAILEEVRALTTEGIGILFITHDLRVLPGLADTVLVMDNGEVAERTTAQKLQSGQLESEAGQRLFEGTRRVAGGRLG